VSSLTVLKALDIFVGFVVFRLLVFVEAVFFDGQQLVKVE
jgi:hypothetical protein